jgi:TatD DNase family protein
MIDIGANLTHPSFASDLPEVLARARATGVSHIVVTGTDLGASAAAVALAASEPGFLSATAGIHPHAAAEAPDGWQQRLLAQCAGTGVVAVGETGLDFHRNYSPADVQERVFRDQLAIAAELGLPVFVHDRDSQGRVAHVLGAFRARLPRVVVHCFTGTAEDLAAYRDLDCHVGITGWVCDERRGQHLAALVPRIAADRLMIETDAPYLLPRTLRPAPRSRRNEPAFLPCVAARISELRGEDLGTVVAETARNAREFFGLRPPAEPPAAR